MINTGRLTHANKVEALGRAFWETGLVTQKTCHVVRQIMGWTCNSGNAV